MDLYRNASARACSLHLHTLNMDHRSIFRFDGGSRRCNGKEEGVGVVRHGRNYTGKQNHLSKLEIYMDVAALETASIGRILG